MVPSGRTRASPPSQKGHRPRRVFFFVRKKTASMLWSARKGFRKAVFFLLAHFHPIKKSACGGPNLVDVKKILFLGTRDEKNDGCFSRIYGIPFGEKRSRLEPETFRHDSERWSGFFKIKDQRSKNKRRSVEKEGSPCGYPVVLGKGGGGG